MKSKIMLTISVVMIIVFVAFVGYGIETDCPNTATYVKCAVE